MKRLNTIDNPNTVVTHGTSYTSTIFCGWEDPLRPNHYCFEKWEMKGENPRPSILCVAIAAEEGWAIHPVFGVICPGCVHSEAICNYCDYAKTSTKRCPNCCHKYCKDCRCECA